MRFNLKKISMYLIFLILVGWYSETLISALNPKVSREYKMHYIDKTLKDWPKDGSLKYIFNTKLNFGLDYKGKDDGIKCRGEGWHDPSPKGNWAKEKADLYLDLSGQEISSDGELELKLHGNEDNSKVDILVNEKAIDSFYPSNKEEKYKFKIPKDILKEEFLCITFKVDSSTEQKRIKNKRELKNFHGVFIRSISLNNDKSEVEVNA